MPDVSVIVPVYNRAHVVGEALESVLNQRDAELEVLAVDDGSSDETSEALAALAKADPRLRPLRHACNLGAAAARNTGIRAARGEFLAFLDSDDLYFPGRFGGHVEYLRSHPDVDFVYGDCEISHPGGKTEIFAFDEENPVPLWERYLCGFPMPLMSFTLRRRCIDKIGLMDETLRPGPAEDLDFLIRLTRHCGGAYLKGACARWRKNHEGNALTSHPFRHRWLGMQVVRRYAGDSGLSPGTRRKAHAMMLFLSRWNAYFQLWNREPSRARAGAWEWMKLQPWHPKPYLYWLASFAPAPWLARLGKARQPPAGDAP